MDTLRPLVFLPHDLCSSPRANTNQAYSPSALDYGYFHAPCQTVTLPGPGRKRLLNGCGWQVLNGPRSDLRQSVFCAEYHINVTYS